MLDSYQASFNTPQELGLSVTEAGPSAADELAAFLAKRVLKHLDPAAAQV